tara:strand:- start:240 stop:434 length:195 start_codon:yes stop_codon:yes gene_type:complete
MSSNRKVNKNLIVYKVLKNLNEYQCLTCKRVVDDCCGGETVECIVSVNNGRVVLNYDLANINYR